MYGATNQQDPFGTAANAARRNLSQVRRHDTYYLKGGDLHVMIDDVIFRVHRYFFIRESAYFREELEYPASPGQPSKGTEDSNAIIIAEDRQGRAVHAIDFEKFLWVFYNPLYSLYDASVEDWSRILHLANTWRFHEVKSLCVRELQRLEMPSVDRIQLYQNFEVDQTLLIPCYAEVCSRETALTVHEGEQLGMKTAMLLMQARERARARDGARSPLPADIRSQQVVSLVEEMFGISSPPSAEPTSPLPSNILFSGSNPPKVNGASTANGSVKTHMKNKSSGGTKPNGVGIGSDSMRAQAQSFDALFADPATTTSQTPPLPTKNASEEQKPKPEEPKPKPEELKVKTEEPKTNPEQTKPKTDVPKDKPTTGSTTPFPATNGVKSPTEPTASGRSTPLPGSAVNNLVADAHAEGTESGTDVEGPLGASPATKKPKVKKTKLGATSMGSTNSTGPTA
jgi:hypothetical protein